MWGRAILAGLLFTPVVGLSGCAQLNEGSVDHRWAMAQVPPVKPAPRQQGGEVPPSGSEATPPYTYQPASQPSHADPSHQSPEPMRSLEYKFFESPGASAIKAGQPLTLTLETAFIRGFQEGFTDKRGEFVVLANVRELGKGTTIAYGQEAEKGARVVYYTGDLRQHEGGQNGQFLSMVSLPLYGPITYEGTPVLVEMHAVEIDQAQSDTIKALLGGLAKAGQMIYPPASPALGILERVGSHMLAGAQNDKEFRNHPMLYPFRDGDGSTHSFLQEGDIVIVKRGNERFGLLSFRGREESPIQWDHLRLNMSNKRLYTKTRDPNTFEEYRDHTYFVINVTTQYPSVTEDVANALYENFGAFLKALKQKPEVPYEDTLKEMLRELQRLRRVSEAEGDLHKLASSAAGPIEKTFARDRLLDLLTREMTAVAEKRELSDDERERLLIGLRTIFGKNWPADWEQMFKTGSVEEIRKLIVPP